MGRAFEYRKARKLKRWGHMARVFTKIGKEIEIAVKAGGPDPSGNTRLRILMQNAKAENMPKENVERAIKRAISKDTSDYKEVVYEGYGPHGIAFLVETATDNTNRTVASMRMYFNKCGGTLGNSGSVAFMFDHKCVFKFHAAEGADMEELELEMIDLGVDAVVSGGQTMNPSTEDILAAIQSVPAKTVLVLPNNKNIIMASEQAQKLADRKVIVLPTRTVPQGMTAMLNFDPELKPEENAVGMMQAADHVSTGLITYAARDSEFDGKPIKKGEIMALENGKIVATGTDIVKMTYRLARSMKKKDSQFITVISGCDVSDEDAEKTTEMVRTKCGSSVEVSHISGGQPVYYYMISVE